MNAALSAVVEVTQDDLAQLYRLWALDFFQSQNTNLENLATIKFNHGEKISKYPLCRSETR
jgi:hypothetical protein